MRRFKNNKGFTLMETLLAVAIIAILAGIAAGGIAGYKRKLVQLNYDTYAKEIFVSAQNHLALASSQDYLGLTDFGSEEDESAGIYYFVVGQNEDDPDDSESVLNLMLPSASVEEYARSSGSYIIRYQKYPAQILDVFYADREGRKQTHTFSKSEYESLISDYTGEDKQEERRNYGADNTIIGYYGGAEASEIEQGEELLSPTVKINNADRLTVTVGNTNSGNSEAALKLVITGETSGNSRTISLVDTNGATYSTGAYKVSYDIISCEFTVVLDDITESDCHFKEFFCSSPNPAENLTAGENIRVKAIAYSSKKITNIADSGEKKTNSLFASEKGGEAEIANFRHLENLSATVSGLGVALSDAKQTSDLKWGKEDSLFNGNTVIYAVDGTETQAGSFSAVELGKKLSYNGNNHSIEGLNISDSAYAGLFGELPAGSAVCGLELIDFNVYSASGYAGGLAGKAAGTELEAIIVRNSSGDDSSLTIKGGSAAGGLVGAMEGGSVESCAAAVYVQALNGDAGGLIGTVNTAVIVNSYSGGHTLEAKYQDSGTGAGRYNVLASGKAGGLIGKAAGTNSISYCYSSCSAHGKEAAGFVCTMEDGTINSSYCVGRASCEGTAQPGAFISSRGTTAFTGTSYYLSNITDDANDEADDNLLAVSAKDTEQPDFIIPEEDRNDAYTYDDALATVYLGKYYFPTVEQLNPSVAVKTFFTSAHYGDWQLPGMDSLDLTLYNNDTLRLEIEKKDEDFDKLTLAVTGEASGKTKVFLLKATETSVTVEKTGTVENKVIVWDTAGTLNKDLPVSGGTENGISVILDDITVAGEHFCQLFGDVLTPGENISIRAGTGEASWLELNSSTTPCQGNSLFARAPEDIGTAKIEYVRQLQNLDPEISDVSTLVKTAELQDNMVWNENLYPKIYNKTGSKSISGSFYGIYNSNLTSFNGNKYTISGLVINSAPSTISSVGAGNSGLFRLVDNSMKAKNVKLENFAVTASGNAGTFAGEVSGTGASLDTVLAVADTARLESTGTGSAAGGLIGKSSASLSIDNSAASVLVRAKGAAGGLVGSSSGELTVTSSYTGGHTNGSGEYALDNYNISSTAAPAGGLVGEITGGSAKIEKSFSAASAASPSSQAAGGVVGKTAVSISLDSAYAIAPVSNVKVKPEDPETSSGAFIGVIETGAEVTNASTYYLPEVYSGSETSNNDSSVAYKGASQGTMSAKVDCAFYTEDESDNAISSRIHFAYMQTNTYPFDASLNEGDPSGVKEYPFAIWTIFDFEGNSNTESVRGTYYGDWQPILSPATVTHTVTFKYIDPVSGEIKAVTGDSLASQKIYEDKDNKLILPSISGTEGYTVNYWYLENDSSARFTEDAGCITLPEEMCDEDLTVIASFKKATDKCTVSFYYDSTGANLSFEQIGRTVTVDRGTDRSSIQVPSRDIPGYTLEGWYSDNKFTNPISFEGGSVSADLEAYAKYTKIEYFTITIDFMYTSEDGDTSHLNNVPRYRVEDEPQYRIQAIKGDTYNESITLPSLGVEPISVTHYEGDEAGQASLSSDKTKLNITADSDSHFIVLYEGSPIEVKHYKIMYRMHNTASGSTPTNLVFSQSDTEVYTYNPYEGQDSGDNFTAPVGTIPDVKPQSITGFVYPSAEDIQNIQITADESANIIYVDYYRNSYVLTFNSMSGTYVEPVILYYGQPLAASEPATNPTRQGYIFSKWCLHNQGEEEATETYSWSDTMPAYNVEAAVKWTPGTSNYTVIFWKQKVTDDKNLSDAQKTYEYDTLVVRTGTTGNTATLTNADTGKSNSGDYVGYNYNSTNSDTAGKVIASNGSTVLNVYYDRNLITMNFSGLGTMYSESTSDLATYGYYNGQYIELTRGDDGNWYMQESYQEQEETLIAYEGTKYFESHDTDEVIQKGVVNGKIVNVYYRAPLGSSTKRWQYALAIGFGDYKGIVYNTSGTGTAYRFTNGAMEALQYIDGQYYYTSVTTVTKYRQVLYEGTRYTKISSPFTGLYGQTLNMYGYSWPEGSWSYGRTGMSYLGQFVLPEPTNTTISFSKDSSTRGAHYYFYLEDESGNYVFDAEGGTSSSGGTFSFTEKYDGYQVVQARTASSKEGLESAQWQSKQAGSSMRCSGYMEIRFARKSNQLNFYNTLEGTVYSSGDYAAKTVKYGNSLAAYRPSSAPTTTRASEGYSWDGKYYMDKACTMELDFDSYRMPDRNLTVYLKFTLPIYTLTFDLNDPAPAEGEAAHYKETAETGYTFSVERNKNIMDDVATQAGNLKAGYTPEKEGWAFEGWYYNEGGESKPFINSMGIQHDMTVYAKWRKTTSTEKRDVTVRYCTLDGSTLAPQTSFSDQTVGYTLTVPAKDIDGYYPQYMMQYLTVSEEGDNVLTFYYNRIEAWTYTVEYYACYNSSLTVDSEIADIGICEESKGYYLCSSENIPAYNQYETVEFQMPDGVSGYHLDHWEYAGQTGSGTLTRISPDGNRTACIKYYVSPNLDDLQISDRNTVYNGSSQALKEETTSVPGGITYPSGVTGSVKLVYRYCDTDGNPLADSEVVDAGVYNMHAYLVLQITGKAQGDSATTTRNFLVYKTTDGSAKLKVARRTVTVTSASATADYDENSALQRSDSTKDITITGPNDGFAAFPSGQGIEIAFSVEAFRLNPGSTYNSFAVNFKNGTNPDNYEIIKVFGVLTVN